MVTRLLKYVYVANLNRTQGLKVSLNVRYCALFGFVRKCSMSVLGYHLLMKPTLKDSWQLLKTRRLHLRLESDRKLHVKLFGWS